MIETAVAEDDFRIASIHKELVNRIDGFHCEFQTLNAKETLELLDQHPIDLLLLDIYMPDELGTDLLKSIREKHPHVDVLIITASTNKEHVERSLKYGVFDYILKPVSLERLEKTLQSYQAFHENLQESEKEEMTQERIDQLTSVRSHGNVTPPNNTMSDLPKGIDALTLQTVKQELSKAENGVTAEEMGSFLGASRTTARRYLEYMISTEEAFAKPIYGIVGRPERRYFLHEAVR